MKEMQESRMGLTQLYNSFHNPTKIESGIAELRSLQIRIDEGVLMAYGWSDIDLEHNFYGVDYLPENDRLRFTISERARIEVLQRLSMLNRERYEQEQQSNQAKTKIRKNNAGKTPKAKVYELPTFHERELPKVADDPKGQMGLLDYSAEPHPKPTKGNQWGSEPIKQILAWLEANLGWHSKQAILNGCQADSNSWDDAITELVGDGFIEVHGQEVSVKYRATS